MDNPTLSVCKECNKTFSSLDSMHRHLKSHKMDLGAYYHKFYPRRDRYDGNLIQFKNMEFYFGHDFNSRSNLIRWIKQTPNEEVQKFIKNLLAARKKAKGIIYTPTQVELRTIQVPGMNFIQKCFAPKTYYQLANELLFKNRFDLLEFEKYIENRHFAPFHRIHVDTREQKPLYFTIKTEPEALAFGDYRFSDNNFSQNVYIERKAVGDLYGTMTGGYERFCREIEKAADANCYLIIVVEAGIDMVESYPNTWAVAGRVNISPEFVFHRVREAIQKYPHIQFLFVKDRQDSSIAIEKIFLSDGQCKRIDLQYLYDTGNLI